VSEFAITAIGRDRPGIVAAVSGALYELGGNIEDSRMAILGGHFAVMLIVEVPAEVAASTLEERLTEVGDELGLDAITVSGVKAAAAVDEATHVVSVYGADHPGIVNAVTSTLAEQGANITDLQTRVSGAAEQHVYVMLIEIGLGESDAETLSSALDATAEQAEVDVTLREIGAETL
jgi:glycine cleavage system transcriptional repressor